MATEDRRKDLMVSLDSKHIWDSVRNAAVMAGFMPPGRV